MEPSMEGPRHHLGEPDGKPVACIRCSKVLLQLGGGRVRIKVCPKPVQCQEVDSVALGLNLGHELIQP